MLILYFNADKFSIKLFYFIYFTVSFVSQWDKYEILTEMQPFKNSLPALPSKIYHFIEPLSDEIK